VSRAEPLGRAWPELRRRLAGARRLAVACDFDGTLAPLVSHPKRARLPRRKQAVLERLRKLPRVSVGIASGRSLADLRRRVGLRGLHYIGSHGLEWCAPGGKLRTTVNARARARIQQLADELERRVRGTPGLYLERKSVSVTLHYRNAPPRGVEGARRVAAQTLRASGNSVRLLAGKKVLEFLPPGRADKGRAVLELARRLRLDARRGDVIVYLGDDVTDESVFRRLRRGDVGLHVGRGPSRARYRLASPAGVQQFLERLAEVRR
jgi:trehalose 6-phosphate phosphatase